MPGRQQWTVVLDPGHGGIDKGAVGSTGLEEKALVLSTARIVRGFFAAGPPIQGVSDPERRSLCPAAGTL